MRKFEDSIDYLINMNGYNILWIDVSQIIKKNNRLDIDLGIKINVCNQTYWKTHGITVEEDFTKEEFVNICEKYNLNWSWKLGK